MFVFVREWEREWRCATHEGSGRWTSSSPTRAGRGRRSPGEEAGARSSGRASVPAAGDRLAAGPRPRGGGVLGCRRPPRLPPAQADAGAWGASGGVGVGTKPGRGWQGDPVARPREGSALALSAPGEARRRPPPRPLLCRVHTRATPGPGPPTNGLALGRVGRAWKGAGRGRAWGRARPKKKNAPVNRVCGQGLVFFSLLSSFFTPRYPRARAPPPHAHTHILASPHACACLAYSPTHTRGTPLTHARRTTHALFAGP